jgi:serine/threonine protein kinase
MTSDTTVLHSIDEAARRKFEAAWRAGRPEPIERFLPDPEQTNYLPTLEELVFIEMEFAGKRHESAGADGEATVKQSSPDTPRPTLPRVEMYLARFPALDRPDVVLRLLKQEYVVRTRAGDRPAVSEYRGRFPAVAFDAQELDTLLAVPGSAPIQAGVAAGVQLGRYRLCAEHARGGFGLVWRASDETLGREVAVKQLSGQLAGHAGLRQRFIGEARIAAQLQHPGIVPVYDLGGQEGGQPFYTMKLVRGQTLTEAIRRYHECEKGDRTPNNQESCPPFRADSEGERALEHLRLLNAFLAVTRALAYAHARGVIHRDLKPDNILLGDYGETVILDWGLAKVLRKEAAALEPVPAEAADPEATQQGTVLGTPVYMAPEQAGGRIHEVNERSDIYALGVILYQLLTGRRPFAGNSSAEVLKQVLETEPARPRAVAPQVPRALEAICLKAMAKRPEERYAEVGLLTRDVERFVADEPVSAYRASRRERLGRWARRHRTAVVAGGVALALLIAGAVGGLFLWQQKEQERRQQAFENEQERRRLVREEEGRRRQEAEQRFARLRSEADTSQRLGLAVVGRIQFNDETTRTQLQTAQKIFEQAVKGLEGQPELKPLRKRIAAHLDRVQRLAEFYLLAEKADRLAFLNRDDEAVANCTWALNQLGVEGNDLKWFEHLVGLGLRPDQLEKLKEDIYRILMLTAAVHFKRAVSIQDEDGSQEAFRQSKKAAQMVQAFRRSQAAFYVEVFCRVMLGERDLPKLTRPEFTGAVDYYYFGFLYLVFRIMPDDPNLRALISIGKMLRITAFDLSAPLETSERLLRQAAALDPNQFWTHFYLGWSLAGTNRLRAAEQAFNTCLALKPRSGMTYCQRAQILWRQREQCLLVRAQLGGVLAAVPAGPWQALPALRLRGENPEVRAVADDPADLRVRILRDLDRAVAYDGPEPFVQWQSGNLYSWLGEMPRALAAWTRYLDMEQSPRAYQGTSLNKEVTRIAQVVKNTADWLTDHGWREAGYWAFRAQAHLLLEEYGPAGEAAAEALKLRPEDSRALAVRGMVRLHEKRCDEALADFTSALAGNPANYLAAAGRARLYEARAEHQKALAAYQEYFQMAARNWQRLEALLGQARALGKLGRQQEAKAAREQARRINPYAAMGK